MKVVANVLKGENVVGCVWEATDKLGRPVYNWELGTSAPAATQEDIDFWPQSIDSIDAGLPRGVKVVTL